MGKDLDKESAEAWYQANKIAADRIINDLKKQSFEGVMHLYAYTSKSNGSENIVSQHDFPILFSNNYKRVGDTIVGAMVFLLHEGNMNFFRYGRIKNTLSYWLVCGNLYETLVSKIVIKAEEAKERLEQNSFTDLKEQLIKTSIQNGIKTQEGWNHFFGTDIQVTNTPNIPKNEEKQMPVELQSKEAQQIISKAIGLGLCDKEYHWQKSKFLLAYFADCASEYLNLSQAEQEGKKKTYWKPFETLFDVSGLATCKNTYTNKTGKLPSGHEVVESIFK